MWRRLRHGRVWRRIFIERGTEPLHLNFAGLFVALFGSFRTKVAFDLVIRQHHAYCLLKAADNAKVLGKRKVVAVEFGVAGGVGLLNMARVARRVTEATGVEFDLYGFDTGKGMPRPRDYRDHPELYAAGDFPMELERLSTALPANVHLIIGELSETVGEFRSTLTSEAPLAFASIDVDYYTSALSALEVLAGAPDCYLPTTLLFCDDVILESHNSWAGEMLAIRDFSDAHELRKIERFQFLRSTRVFKQATWIDQVYTLHVLDHPERQPETARAVPMRQLDNVYLP